MTRGLMPDIVRLMNTDAPLHYTIRLKGQLDARWSDWFEGLSMTYRELPEDETILSGYLADQAALYGVLERIRDLNLPLIGVWRAGDARQAGEA